MMDAQKFMNDNGLKVCYEVDALFFKQEDNADARALSSGKEKIVHEVNAGVASARSEALAKPSPGGEGEKKKEETES